MDPVVIRQASIGDLEIVTPLFDAYRQFYRKPPDADGARRFLRKRLERAESVILLAIDGTSRSSAAAGFTQLYPSFSSGSMAPIFVLNDLFVAPEGRRRGTGSALLRAAADFGRRNGAIRLTLQTELTNQTAQSVYERMGWLRDTEFCSYQFEL
jgi:GNAT superfamily N-acetyltransferase